MGKFGCGVLATLGLFLAGLAVWFSLSEQSRGIVVGLVLGGAGMFVGVILALAVVAIFLLRTMHWQVQGGKAPPVIMGYPSLQAPPQEQSTWSTHPPPNRPAWERPGRPFRVLGEEDAPPPGTQSQGDPPGTRPMW